MLAFTLFTTLLGALSAYAAPAARGVGSPSELELSARAGGYPNIPGDNGSCARIGRLCSADIANTANAGRGPLGKSKACALSTMYVILRSGGATLF
jgi:hypothetical protein